MIDAPTTIAPTVTRKRPRSPSPTREPTSPTPLLSVRSSSSSWECLTCNHFCSTPTQKRRGICPHCQTPRNQKRLDYQPEKSPPLSIQTSSASLSSDNLTLVSSSSIYQRTSSNVTEVVTTPKLNEEQDSTDDEDSSFIQSSNTTESSFDSTPSDIHTIATNHSLPVSLESSASESDGDTEMKHMDEVDEEVSIISASTGSSLDRTFSTARTPIQLSQDDEREQDSLGDNNHSTSDEDEVTRCIHIGRTSSKKSDSDSLASPTIISLPDLSKSVPATKLAKPTSIIPVVDDAIMVDGEITQSPPQILKRSDALVVVKPVTKKQKTTATKEKVERPPPSKAESKSSYRLDDFNSVQTSLSPPAASFHLSAVGATCCGFFRKQNQDAYVCQVIPGFGDKAPIFLSAVFDGHGVLGHLAATTCKRALPNLFAHALLRGEDVKQALISSLAELHTQLNEAAEMIRTSVNNLVPHLFHNNQESTTAASNSTVGGRTSSRNHTSPPKSRPTGGLYGSDYGTTAIIAVVEGSTLTVANVGDSQCMVLSRDARTPSLIPASQTPSSSPDAASTTSDASSASASNASSLHSSPPSSLSSNSVDDISSSPESSLASNNSSTSADEWTIVYVSDLHNCDAESERKRVKESGGELHWTGTEYRVYPNNLEFQEARSQQLTINMSRSLGHIKLGEHGISAEPHLREINLSTQMDHIIVLGSDGLFDVLEPGQIRSIVAHDHRPLNTLIHQLLQKSDTAWQEKKHGDNVTSVVAKLMANSAAKKAN